VGVGVPMRPALIVPLMRQCAGTKSPCEVVAAATGCAEVTTVLGTGKAEAGNDAVLHASTGALASATFSVAIGFFSLAFFSSSNVLMPGRRPVTVPLLAPAPLGESAEVTSWPFNSSVARRSAESGAVMLTGMELPLVTKIGSGVFRLVMP